MKPASSWALSAPQVRSVAAVSAAVLATAVVHSVIRAGGVVEAPGDAGRWHPARNEVTAAAAESLAATGIARWRPGAGAESPSPGTIRVGQLGGDAGDHRRQAHRLRLVGPVGPFSS